MTTRTTTRTTTTTTRTRTRTRTRRRTRSNNNNDDNEDAARSMSCPQVQMKSPSLFPSPDPYRHRRCAKLYNNVHHFRAIFFTIVNLHQRAMNHYCTVWITHHCQPLVQWDCCLLPFSNVEGKSRIEMNDFPPKKHHWWGFAIAT